MGNSGSGMPGIPDIGGLIKNAFEFVGKEIIKGVKSSVFDPIEDIFGQIERGLESAFSPLIDGVTSIINSIESIIDTVTIMFTCLIAFFNFVAALFVYFGDWTSWFFVYFLPWIGQYFDCSFQKITYIPKCFMWYLLDAIYWAISLPFRITFYLLGIEDLVRDYFWCVLEDIDKYIHDDEPEGMGTGVHIIHFPDSVMEKCYRCNIKPIGKKMPNTSNLNIKYSTFIDCRNKQSSETTCCNPKVNANFEKPEKARGSPESDNKVKPVGTLRPPSIDLEHKQ